MAYYNVIFDRAADQLFETLGLGPEYVKLTNNSFFTLETHTSYLREVKATDTVKVESQLLDCDQKRVHYLQQMKHASEGWVACILEVMVAHVDLNLHKTSNFPEDVRARIAALHEAHKGMPVPLQVGHRIGIPRKN